MLDVSFQNLYSQGIFRVQGQLLRTRLGVFQMVGGLGTALPVNLQDVPRVDRGIQVDERGHSLNALVGIDSNGTRLAKWLKIQDGLRHNRSLLCSLSFWCDGSLGSAVPAFCHWQHSGADNHQEAKRKLEVLAVITKTMLLHRRLHGTWASPSQETRSLSASQPA